MRSSGARPCHSGALRAGAPVLLRGRDGRPRPRPGPKARAADPTRGPPTHVATESGSSPGFSGPLTCPQGGRGSASTARRPSYPPDTRKGLTRQGPPTSTRDRQGQKNRSPRNSTPRMDSGIISRPRRISK
ncbi:uncharacterized protein AAEQ78_006076 [Lycaon pictus]